jgi:hypothetical protein
VSYRDELEAARAMIEELRGAVDDEVGALRKRLEEAREEAAALRGHGGANPAFLRERDVLREQVASLENELSLLTRARDADPRHENARAGWEEEIRALEEALRRKDLENERLRVELGLARAALERPGEHQGPLTLAAAGSKLLDRPALEQAEPEVLRERILELTARLARATFTPQSEPSLGEGVAVLRALGHPLRVLSPGVYADDRLRVVLTGRTSLEVIWTRDGGYVRGTFTAPDGLSAEAWPPSG